MKQRVLALLLTLAMLVSMSTATISALASTNPTITLEKKEAYVGDDISIVVSIENNPGIWGMDLRISYDKTVMTLTSVENGDFYQNSEWTAGNLNADVYILSYEASGFDDITTAFIRDFTCEYSIFCLDTVLFTEQAGSLLFCYAGSSSVRYSTATPLRVSALMRFF